MPDSVNEVRTLGNERSSSCFGDLDRLLADPHYGAAELARLHEQYKKAPHSAAALDYRRLYRPKIVDWLVKVFDSVGLRDEWLVNCICLLDRISAGAAREGGVKIEERSVLCAVLMALKISSAEAETRMSLKDIIFYMMRGFPSLDSEKLWSLIFLTELKVLPLIDFRVAQPTAMDLVGRLSLDVALAAPETDAAAGTWPGLARVEVAAYTRVERDARVPIAELRPRFLVFSRFLVELALLHREGDACVLAAGAPLVLALAAVHVALDSFAGCPPEPCWRVFLSAKQLLAGREAEQLAECVPLLRELWSAGSPGEAVVQKWTQRQIMGDRLLPQSPADTETQLLPQPSADIPAAPVPSSAGTPPRRRPKGPAMEPFSSLKEVRPASNAAAATEGEPACEVPTPLLGDASATDIVVKKKSKEDEFLERSHGHIETIPQQEQECSDGTYAGNLLHLSDAIWREWRDMLDATSCRIAYEVDNTRRRCRTKENEDAQGVLKRPRQRLLQCG